MKSIKTLAITLIGAAMLSSCGKGFLDINDDPNKAVSSSPDLVLPTALLTSTRITNTTTNQLGALWGGQWAAAIDFLWFIDEKQYNITASFYTSAWTDSYNTLNDYKFVETDAKARGWGNYEGIAQIMQGYQYAILVDLYNNIPFSEALQATKVIRPKYDDGQAVYEGALALITSGIETIKATAADSKKPAADDIIFKGNMTNWIKFGNTLKLRMLLRQSELGAARVDGYVKTEIAKIVAEGSGFLGEGLSANAQPGYTATASKQNPFWDAYYKTAAGTEKSDFKAVRPTLFIVGYYKAFNDSLRLATLYTKVGGDYKGVALGQNTGDAEAVNYKSSVTSPLAGGLLKSASQPAVVLSSFESLFLQAEAAQRGWITGSAQTFYETAIKESFVYLGVPNAATAAAAYYGQAIDRVGFAASANKITAIITQKWLALNSISSFEAWNDFRRLGIPADMPLSKSATIQKYPSRLLYPNGELGTNGAEVEKQNITDPFDQKVFWDK